MLEVPSYVIAYPFETVRSAMETLDIIDGSSAGGSPVTIRVLTKKNQYINIGLQIVDEKTCEILRNNNSYEVVERDLVDAHAGISDHVAKYVIKEAEQDARENPQNSKGLPGKGSKDASGETANA